MYTLCTIKYLNYSSLSKENSEYVAVHCVQLWYSIRSLIQEIEVMVGYFDYGVLAFEIVHNTIYTCMYYLIDSGTDSWDHHNIF